MRTAESTTLCSRRAIFVMLAVILLFPALSSAQETTAGLQGYVKDQSGGVIPNAGVKVKSPALIVPKATETDQGGYYRFANLPPGTYTLSVTATGFRTYEQTGIELGVGRLPNIDVKLEVGAMSQTVEVTGKAPLVDVTQSKAAVNIPLEVLNLLPKGRSFQSLIPFAPGARQEPLQSNGRGSNGFQIDGASDSENSYLVEGMDTTEIKGGGVGQNVPLDFVQELQIKSSGFDAEYGALGGVVNVIQRRGGNNWHGSVFTYYRSDGLNASDHSTLRLDTAPGQLSSAKRTAEAPQYYKALKDPQRTLEPGFEAGGFLRRDRIWMFGSYIPSLDRLDRTVTFQGQSDPANNGPRTFHQRIDTHNALGRLDFSISSKIHAFAAWQYGYSRSTGIFLPSPDSVLGQFNKSSTTDPNNFKSAIGTVNPQSLYTFGADWSVTPHLVVTGRYGYWFTNASDRGKPAGDRYLYSGTAQGAKGLDGSPVPTSFANPDGFFNIANNYKQIFDFLRRQSLSTDASYFKTGWGTHNFKFGYGNNRITNNLLKGYDNSLVNLFYSQSYSPNGQTGADACATIAAQNKVTYGVSDQCQGKYGYYTVSDFETTGKVSSYNHYLYAQDSWSVGKGVTLNLGVRADKEFLPPYTQGAPHISFGFGQKVAPRLGIAWDVLRNGKMKIYGSYGWFYDIMKYSLPRGSFGGEYWHDCTYTLDNPDYTLLKPVTVGGHFCPGSGNYPGKLIEEFNFRSVIIDPNNPGVDPNIKPMRQHEYVIGTDYAFSPSVGLEIRYARKVLDRAIEDVGVTVPGNELYFIGNPGEGIVGNLLQRPVTDSSALPFTTYPVQCPSCPLSPRAYRNYDGLEFRLLKRTAGGWFGSASYTYSRLYGNYSGLTSTELSDTGSAATVIGGGGGRHDPNNNRAFDLPQMQFTAHGVPQFGPLGTDRPHTVKLYGSYRLKWMGESTFGVAQQLYSGTPLSTTWPEVSTASAVQFVENRGNFVKIHRDPVNGDLVSDGIINGFRTEGFRQTDFSFTHEFRLGQNEARRIGIVVNFLNLFNEHHVLAASENPIRLGHSEPLITSGPNKGSPDYVQLTKTGFDYIAQANAQRKNYNNLYGLPSLFQFSRTIRLEARFSF